MIRALRCMLADDGGATLAEYGIIAALLAVPLIVAATAIIGTAASTLSSTTSGMQTIGANPP